MVPLHTVTTDILNGTQRRAHLIAIPKTNAPITKAPGIFRPFFDRFGFRRQTVARAIELVSPGRFGTTPLAASHDRPDGRSRRSSGGGETGAQGDNPRLGAARAPVETWILSSGTRFRRFPSSARVPDFARSPPASIPPWESANCRNRVGAAGAS
jgi:hypothetical protein